MSNDAVQPRFAATSAAGSMLPQIRGPLLVGWMLSGLGTSTAYALPRDLVAGPGCVTEQTTAGAYISVASAGATIGELRRLTGLTWDQLARLFSVSRRSLHFWASGKRMTPTNEEHLHRILAVVRKVDRGSASANRAALLDAGEDGNHPFDLLAAGSYEHVLSLLGLRESLRSSPPRLSREARAARAPRPPEELVGALQDRIHRDGGAVRAAKSARVGSDR